MSKTPEEVHDADVKAAADAKAKADKAAADSADAVRKALDAADKAKAKLDAEPGNAGLKAAHEHAVVALAKAEEDAGKKAAEADAKTPKQEYLLALVSSVPEFTLRNGVKVPNPLNETNSTKLCADSVEDAIRIYNTGRHSPITRKMLRVFDCLANKEVPLVAPVPVPPPAPVL